MNYGDLFWLIFGSVCVAAWTVVRVVEVRNGCDCEASDDDD